jgi:hypothetical protein
MTGYALHPEARFDLIQVRDYLIAMRPMKNPLWVVAVLHGHRDARVMAVILRGREQDPGFFAAMQEK